MNGIATRCSQFLPLHTFQGNRPGNYDVAAVSLWQPKLLQPKPALANHTRVRLADDTGKDAKPKATSG